MSGRLVTISLLVANVQAFVPAPIRWGGLPGKRLLLAPSSPPNRALVLPSPLMVVDGSGTMSSEYVPHFATKADSSIAWDDDLCLEAAGASNGDMIRINRCTGSPNQKWDFVPWNHGQKNLLRLQGSDKCMDVNDAGGLDGARVELRECDNNKLTESWKFEASLLPSQGAVRKPVSPSSMRHVVFYCVSFAGLVALSFGAWLWQGRKASRSFSVRQNCEVCGSELFGMHHVCHGGVSMCSSLTAHSGNVQFIPEHGTSAQELVPAVMALGPMADVESGKLDSVRQNCEFIPEHGMSAQELVPAVMALRPMVDVESRKLNSVRKVAREIDIKVPPMDLEADNADQSNTESKPISQAPVGEDSEVIGNLARYDDTWHIVREGDKLPASAVLSDCRIDARPSEYAANSCESIDGPQAWMSKSLISFDYRVVEVPRGSLLDPSNDALLFGHLEFNSQERQEAMTKPQRRLIVIDETVDDLYGDKVRAYFTERGVEHEVFSLPLVEENKSMDLTLEVCKKMKQFDIDRRTEPVIAIGGGVALDVVGLAASLFRRRTPYIRVPTTSLAYVDASVGAKNGCNFCGSKNRLGTYVPPVAALLDSSFFKTQERRQVSNSLGEMAKMAIMKSETLLRLLQNHAPRLIDNRFEPKDASDDVPERVLRLSIETMLEELAPNLWEHSLDRLVDFGHAVGQELEMRALTTEHKLMHGEAVAVDMAYFTVLSFVLGYITADERDVILQTLRTCELPVHSPVFTRKFFKEAMADRVKNSMGQRLPLPVGIGRARMTNDVSDEDFEKAFVEWEKLCSPIGQP